jgi:hypothetical protein
MSLVAVNPATLATYDDPDASVIALCERGSAAIEQAATVADARDIRDWADTIEHAAKVRDLNHETIILASALKIRAERRIGQLLGEAENHGPATVSRDSRLGAGSPDAERQLRREYRHLAEPDEETFEHALSEVADDAAGHGGISRRSVRQKLDETQRDQAEQAEWVRSLGEDPDPEATRQRGIAHRAVIRLMDGVDRLTSQVTPEALVEALATYPERQTYVRDGIVADLRRAAREIARYEEALR